MIDIDAATPATDSDTTTTPIIEVTFSAVDSAAFSVKFAGVSPAMFAAFASWCNYMSTKGYAERDYAEAMKANATNRIVPVTVLPGGRH